MGLFERVIRALLYLCVIAICFYLIIWVLGSLGLAIPYMVMNILKVMFVLIAILILVRLFFPVFSGYDWWGSNRRS
jgi:hypothetical protein